MRNLKSHLSIGLKKTTLLALLTATMCIPTHATEAVAGDVVYENQSIQQSRTVKGHVVDKTASL